MSQQHVVRSFQGHTARSCVDHGPSVHGERAAVGIQGHVTVTAGNVCGQRDAAASGHGNAAAGGVLDETVYSYIVGVAYTNDARRLQVQFGRIDQAGNATGGDQRHVAPARIEQFATVDCDRAISRDRYVAGGRHVVIERDFAVAGDPQTAVHAAGADDQRGSIRDSQTAAGHVEADGTHVQVCQRQFAESTDVQRPRGQATSHAQVAAGVQVDGAGAADVQVRRHDHVAIGRKCHGLPGGGAQRNHIQGASDVQVHIARTGRRRHQHVVAVDRRRHDDGVHIGFAGTLVG